MKIGKSDPSTILIIKTFNQIQTKYNFEKGEIILKNDDISKNKKNLQKIFIFFQKHILVIIFWLIIFLNHPQFLGMDLRDLDHIVEV